MGVYTRRWAGNAVAGEVMFVNNDWLRTAGLKKSRLVPLLFQKRGDRWKLIEKRLFEEAIYAPFVSAPWFFLQLPSGEQRFKIALGNIDQEISCLIEEKTIHVIPFVITEIDAIKKGRDIEYIFAMKLNPEVSLPFFDAPGAETDLARALDSDEPGVRYRSCRELEKIRKAGGLEAETIERLKQVAEKDPVELVREGAEKALGR